MDDHPFYRLAERLSPRTWLLIATVMLMLGAGSAWTLHQHFGEREKEKLFFYYELANRFIDDTIRLTFKRSSNQESNQAKAVLSDAVRIAPLNLLHPEATFHWISVFDDFVPLPDDETLPDPVAPVRLLDPEWMPLK
jgi:hypothetical protein